MIQTDAVASLPGAHIERKAPGVAVKLAMTFRAPRLLLAWASFDESGRGGQVRKCAPRLTGQGGVMRKNVLLTVAAGMAALLMQARHDVAAAQTRALDIYVVDVEGGNATLAARRWQ
jgi:hypothetical protein